MAEFDTHDEPETEAYRQRAYEKRDKERKTLYWVGGKPKKPRIPVEGRPKKPRRKKGMSSVDEVMHEAFKDI